MIESRYKFSEIEHFNHTFSLLDYALDQVKLDGIYIELGVYQGSTINFMAKKLNPTLIYGFDSFEGLPEHWNFENPKGAYTLNGNMPTVESNVILYKGLFDQSLPKFVNEINIDRIPFVHFDADLYSSTKCGLDNFRPFFKDEVIFVFNEFCNYPGWEEGEYKALNEFLETIPHELIPLGKVGNTYCNYACKIIFK